MKNVWILVDNYGKEREFTTKRGACNFAAEYRIINGRTDFYLMEFDSDGKILRKIGL
jgi:hypothetical protein